MSQYEFRWDLVDREVDGRSMCDWGVSRGLEGDIAHQAHTNQT